MACAIRRTDGAVAHLGERFNGIEEVGGSSPPSSTISAPSIVGTVAGCAECYETDAYGMYGALPVNKHVVGKYGAVNRNEGLHSVLRGKLNKLVRRAKGYSKTDMNEMSLSIARLR